MNFSNEHNNTDSEYNRTITNAAHNVALNRVNDISRESEEEKGIEALINEIENGSDEFLKEDVENFRRGRKDLIDAPRAMYIETYLRAIEKVSKNLNNLLQPECAEIIASFPHRLR
jgi:hypothetical protein